MKSSAAYDYALKNGWMDEICSHMKYVNKPRGYWTKEKCHIEALKYKTRSEFKKSESSAAYDYAIRNGWIDEICSHMKRPKPLLKWSKERCQEEALKYKTRSEFSKGNASAYRSSRKNGWLDEFFPKKK